MTFDLPTRPCGATPRGLRAGAAAALTALGLLFAGSNALAAPPPANTVIGNQASATYKDPNGADQSATSNLVQTTVQPVGAFTLDGKSQDTTDVVNTKNGAAGVTVYAPHVLTNRGNDYDTFKITVTPPTANGFSKVEVFADANGDGLPDNTTSLCTQASSTSVCEFTTANVAGNNGTFPFVVAYSIPSTAQSSNFGTNGTAAATVKAVPTLVARYTAPNTSASDVDNVVLVTGAAFNAYKSLSAPAFARPTGTWPTATTGPRGTSATYTITFNNTGGAAGKFVFTDQLPTGFDYVAGSAVWSSQPGTALTDAAGGDPAGTTYEYDSASRTMTFSTTNLAPNVTQTVSFVVTVNTTAALGTSTTNNQAKYSPTNSTSTPASTDATSTTNLSPFTVTGNADIVLGTQDATASVTASRDGTANTPNTTAADTNTVASAPAGSVIKFNHKAFNPGDASDIVNLTVFSNTFPAGTTFRFFAADGNTPLIDNNSDGIVDTGPIAVGGNVNFVLAATLPSSATASNTAVNVIVRGASAADSSKTDTTRDTLSAITGTLVDLTNTAAGTSGASGDLGTGPSQSPTTTKSTAAGTGTLFDLFVRNNDSVARTYNLAASQTNSFPGSLPAGWTVKFVASGGTCASPAITTADNVAANSQAAFHACVTPPATQVPTTQNIYFRVSSNNTTGVIAVDTKLDAVTVTAANTYTATLTPNNSGQVAPGGSVVYPHTLTNTGGQICQGPYSITASSSGAGAGWTTAIYLDVNQDGQIDAGDTLVTGDQPGPLNVGATQKLLVRVFAPGGATPGSADTVTVNVTFSPPAGTTACTGQLTATDITTVITGQIRLVKSQAKDVACDGGDQASLSGAALQAKPGECLLYRVVATNEGVAPVTNLSINDAVPAYTTLVTAPAAVAGSCAQNGMSAGSGSFAFTISGSGSGVRCASDANGNTLSPGGTATMTFTVKIDSN